MHKPLTTGKTSPRTIAVSLIAGTIVLGNVVSAIVQFV